MTTKFILANALSMFVVGPGLAQQSAPIAVEHGLVQGGTEGESWAR